MVVGLDSLKIKMFVVDPGVALVPVPHLGLVHVPDPAAVLVQDQGCIMIKS